jgi:hypothetical protein
VSKAESLVLWDIEGPMVLLEDKNKIIFIWLFMNYSYGLQWLAPLS